MILKTSRLFLEVVLVAVAALATFIGVSAWRLSEEPISLDFITPYVAEALRQQDQAVAVQIDRTVLTWASARHALEIRAVGVRVTDAKGQTVGRAPEISIDFSIKAMARGLVAPSRLTVLRPQLRLDRAPDGRVFARFGADAPAADRPAEAPARTMPPFVGELLGPPDPERAFGYLEQVAIVDADVIIHDQRLGQTWRAPNSDIMLARDQVGLRGEARLDIVVDDRRTKLVAGGVYSNVDGRFDLTVGFEKLEPAVLAAGSSELRMLAPFKLSLDGTAQLSADRWGKISDIDIDIRRGRGKIDTTDDRLPDLDVDTAHGRLLLSGDLDRIGIDNLSVGLVDGPSLKLSAESRRRDGGRDVSATVSVRDLPLSQIGRYWPTGAAGGARNWIVTNITGGTISTVEAAIGLRLTPKGASEAPDKDWTAKLTAFNGAMLYQGLEVTYLAPLPQVVGIDGAGTFDLTGFDLGLATGHHEGLEVGKSRVRIVGLDEEEQHALIDVRLKGGLREALTVLNHERLGYPDKLGIDPQRTSGDADIRLKFDVPLRHDLTFDQVAMDVRADLSDLAWQDAPLGQEVTKGGLHLRLNGERLVAKGDVTYGGLPLQVAWTENFGDGVPWRRRLAGKGVANADYVRRFGVDLTSRVAGPLPTEFVYTAHDGGDATIAFDVDIAPATVTVPELNWSKAADAGGTAKFVMAVAGGAVVGLRDIVVKTDDLSAAGNLGFAAGTSDLASADVERIVVGKTDLSGKLQRGRDGTYLLKVSGGSLDITDLLQPGKESIGFDFPPMRLTADIARLYTRPDRFLSDTHLSTHFDGEDWREIHFRGLLTHSTTDKPPAQLIGELAPNGKERPFTVKSEDAGAVVWTLGLSDNVIGGTLAINGSIDDRQSEQPVSAEIGMRDYKLFKAPLTARLLTLASFTGIANLLAGEGISVSRLDVPVTKVGDLVTVKDGRMVGSELGFTMNGTVDLARNSADLGGTIVPAYTLNSVLGNIPLLGTVFVGEKGSGVFAAAYRMQGPLDDPDITVNPLAALTPGFLRGIFGGPGTSAPAQQDAEAPVRTNRIDR